MTITASPITVTRRNAAVSASAWFHTTDPGEFVVDYPDGITGPPTVEAAGTRVWTIGSRGGQYLARASVGQDREDVTWLFEIDAARIKNTSTTSAPNTDYEPLIGSFRQDLLNRANWFVFCWRNPNGLNVGMMDSIDVGTAPFHFINATALVWTNNNKIKYAITKAAGGSTKFYTSARATVTTAARNSTGTMGGSEVLAINAGPLTQCSKILRVVSDAELDAWFATGAIPATNQEFVFVGGHEIDPAAPVIYDSSANAYDLTALQVTNWQAPGMRGDTTDTGFSSPLVELPLVIAADCTAGVKSITLRRTRVGIPARVPPLSDAILYDDGVIPVTVAVTAESVTIGPDTTLQVASYPATFDLILSGNYDGAATVVSDDANLVPTSPVTITDGVAVVACTVAADVTGATVTATGPGGDTDACSVTVAEVPEEIAPIKIGPSQTLRSGVTSIYLHITGEDGTCTVTASPVVGLSGVPATVTIASGEADLTLTKMSAGTYTITATQGALADTCTIIVPVGFTAATEYDLVQDIADMIETYGVGYHYDPELLTDTGGDLEDRMFTIRETGVVDGPMIGGKTVTIAVDAYYCNRAPSSDAKALIDYLNCEADAPSYVHALFATGGIVSDFEGAQKITYEIQVSLG